ncbi:hypothetical protein [Herbaspirillum robiniae]|uniref:hypothetical protein n=1 Tax=Herbaspirillum robiniae TaxID=2014887 RepID=UPI003D784BD4
MSSKITDFFSIRDNGKRRSEESLPANIDTLKIEEFWKYWGNEVAKEWQFEGQIFRIDFRHIGLSIIELLPDKSGFFALPCQRSRAAYILNGDASVRFTLEAAFNIRNFDVEKLGRIRGVQEDDARVGGYQPIPLEEQAVFHDRTERKDVLEIFGDDGLGDCYYVFDSDTGVLVSTRTFPRRS